MKDFAFRIKGVYHHSEQSWRRMINMYVCNKTKMPCTNMEEVLFENVPLWICWGSMQHKLSQWSITSCTRIQRQHYSSCRSFETCLNSEGFESHAARRWWLSNRCDSRMTLLLVGREISALAPAVMFTWSAAHKPMTALQRAIQTISDGRPSRLPATCSAISQHAEHLWPFLNCRW